MVLRVCNQALKDPHAAEDAFQATFLVLASQSGSIRKHDSLGSWLFGVACRAAARIRMTEARRQRYERRGSNVQAIGNTDSLDSSEHWPELHAEIARLPEKYRNPIVLCYFEGLTHEQAAGQLGWPVGTVKTRLARARQRLRLRLKRGDWGAGPWIPTESLAPSDISDVPRLLLDSTSREAVGFVSGAGGGGFTSSGVLAITHGVLRAMLIHKLKLATIALLGVITLGLGAIVLARQAPRGRQADDRPGPASTTAKGDSQPTVLRLSGTTEYVPSTVSIVRTQFDNCRVDEVLVGLGATVNSGDPLVRLFQRRPGCSRERIRGGAQTVGARQESPRLQDSTGQGELAPQERADRCRVQRGPQPTEDEDRQGQAPGRRPERGRDHERPQGGGRPEGQT